MNEYRNQNKSNIHWMNENLTKKQNQSPSVHFIEFNKIMKSKIFIPKIHSSVSLLRVIEFSFQMDEMFDVKFYR